MHGVSIGGTNVFKVKYFHPINLTIPINSSKAELCVKGFFSVLYFALRV